MVIYLTRKKKPKGKVINGLRGVYAVGVADGKAWVETPGKAYNISALKGAYVARCLDSVSVEEKVKKTLVGATGPHALWVDSSESVDIVGAAYGEP